MNLTINLFVRRIKAQNCKYICMDIVQLANKVWQKQHNSSNFSSFNFSSFTDKIIYILQTELLLCMYSPFSSPLINFCHCVLQSSPALKNVPTHSNICGGRCMTILLNNVMIIAHQTVQISLGCYQPLWTTVQTFPPHLPLPVWQKIQTTFIIHNDKICTEAITIYA